MRPNFRTIVLTGLLASAGLGSAFAQQQPPQPVAPDAAPAAAQPGGPRGPGAREGRFDPARREAEIQKQFAVLKAKLRIAPQQEGAWNTFTAALRPAERPDAQRPDREEIARLTTPQRIDRMQEFQARRVAESQRRGDAVKTFYASLNPAQQQTFDALPPPHFGGFHGGGGHGPHGGPHQPGGPRPMGGALPPPPAG